MKTLSLIVLVLSFTFAAPATAADKDGNFTAQGNVSCGKWVEGRKTKGMSHFSFRFWIAGYFTAFNRQTPDVSDILGSTDLKSVFLWMDKYCQENPLGDMSDGIDVLTIELWPNRKRTKDD